MKKIINYTILNSNYDTKLIEEVNEKIEKGWQPYGDLNVTKIEIPSIMGGEYNQLDYSQAMVKYKENSLERLNN